MAFWNKEKVTQVEDVTIPEWAVATPDAPTESLLGEKRSINAALTKEEMEEYERTARVVGFAPVGVAAERLKAVLQDENISAYNYEAVSKYLDKHFKFNEYHGTGGWSWIPLREDDKNKNWQGWDHGNRAIDNSRVYTEPIPYAVLMTVKKIHERMPEATFFVSGERRKLPKGDPFLAVSVPRHAELFVIERWDEPGFRDDR